MGFAKLHQDPVLGTPPPMLTLIFLSVPALNHKAPEKSFGTILLFHKKSKLKWRNFSLMAATTLHLLESKQPSEPRFTEEHSGSHYRIKKGVSIL